MMAGVRLDLRWKFLDLQVIILENEYLRVHLLPELGAKIYDIIYKPLSYNFMWHNPRINPEKVMVGTNYDDHFSGGWDVLFPNDAPSVIDGEAYPDHGEMWCQPWKFEIHEQSNERCEVHLWCEGRVTPTLMEIWISLEAGKKTLFFRHRLSNTGTKPIDFLWKLHPAVNVSQYHRIDVPGSYAEFVDPNWSRFGDRLKTFPWPIAESPDGSLVKDYRTVDPIDTGLRDFMYVKDLKEGWCAVTDTRMELGMGLVFPKELFKTVWLFLTYGGWRNLYTAILEPCTAYPKDLETAIKTGDCGHLEGGDILEFQVGAVIYTGLRAVSHIDMTRGAC